MRDNRVAAALWLVGFVGLFIAALLLARP